MQALKIITKSAEETKKVGEALAREILKTHNPPRPPYLKGGIVISLEGELGSGKTTFAQGFAKGLGIKENPRSPTFVIMRAYTISHKPYALRQLIHVDAYRLSSKDFKALNWKDFVHPPAGGSKNIILVEWGNRVKNILPKNSARIVFKHTYHKNRRLIKIIL